MILLVFICESLNVIVIVAFCAIGYYNNFVMFKFYFNNKQN